VPQGGASLFHIVIHILFCVLTLILSISVAAVSAAFIVASWRLVGAVSRKIEPSPPQPPPAPTVTLEGRILELELGLERLTVALDDGISGYRRAEKRIQKTVTSARRLVKESGLEHAALEAESEEIRGRDAEGIPPLSAMPTPVAATRTIRIPGGHLEIGAA